MMSAGFQWGANDGLGEQRPKKARDFEFHSIGHSLRQSTNYEKPSKKRRHDDEPVPAVQRTAPNKRSKTPKILGQRLPLPRLIEVLDHKSLQSLLVDLMQIHPEMAQTVTKLSPKPTLANSIDLVREKFATIGQHLPYKCDVESDYSYLRVKPHIHEFLNCLSDFILNFLPPIEHNVINSLTFLDKVTALIHDLPNFSNNEFQYTKLMAYEQLANTWIIVLSQKLDEKPESSAEDEIPYLYKVIVDLQLDERLAEHDTLSGGKFRNVVEFVNAEKHQADVIMNSGTQASGLGDFITMDYSNYLISTMSKGN